MTGRRANVDKDILAAIYGEDETGGTRMSLYDRVFKPRTLHAL